MFFELNSFINGVMYDLKTDFYFAFWNCFYNFFYFIPIKCFLLFDYFKSLKNICFREHHFTKQKVVNVLEKT